MKDDHDLDRYFSGILYRWLSGLFGAFLVAVGLYAIFFGVVTVPIRLGLGLLIVVLGAEAIWSAFHSKQSWLAQFAPFF